MKRFMLILMAMALGIALSACAETGGSVDPNEPGAITQPTAETDDLVNEEANEEGSVSNIDDDAESFYGQTVTTTGEVSEIYSENMFRISDPSLIGGDDVLVYFPNGFAANEAQILEVTGMVQMYDQSELEQTLGVDIDDALMGQLDGQPVIVADNVMETDSITE